jgi:uncharacterized membrane protein (UPF0127 family)
MDARSRTVLAVVVVSLVALAGCGAPGGQATSTPGSRSATPTAPAGDATATDATATEEPTPTPTPAPTGNATASATFRDGGESLATVRLEVADSPSERRRGLMNRTALPENYGMVFVYEDAEVLSFWMKNTLVPLDMIFVAPNGTVLNVEHAATQPDADADELRTYRSAGPAQFVVEVERGFANRTGVGPGTTVAFEGLNASGSE